MSRSVGSYLRSAVSPGLYIRQKGAQMAATELGMGRIDVEELKAAGGGQRRLDGEVDRSEDESQ